ncbi:hypothetical protein [Dyella sp. 20L07]|uniref:phage major capsid protein n=1 Tax=Dyella sp. 20L07 TaxID=3384240 RepID=UPI003D2D62E2
MKRGYLASLIAATFAETSAIVGETALREAAASEYGNVMQIVNAAVRQADPTVWGISSLYPDRAVVSRSDGRQYAYPYTIGDDNTVALGAPYEVVATHIPAATDTNIREAAPNNPKSASQAGTGKKTTTAGALQGEVFIESVVSDGDAEPSRYLVRVIRAGVSLNKVSYPKAVLREAAPLFNGVRVFVKSDAEHIKGGGKDFRQLVGRLSDAKYVEADGGQIQATLDVLESSDVADKLREAVQRGMTDLFGLSIDASGKSKTNGKFREATSITKVDSVDLIIEPGAGGQFIRFAEAAGNHEENTMLREQMIEHIRRRDAKRAEQLAGADDAAVLTAYREAVAEETQGDGIGKSVTAESVAEQIRMVEARANARVAIHGAKLPQAAKDRLTQRFAEAASFTDADVTKAIDDERAYLGSFREARIEGLGSDVQTGDAPADKIKAALDNFFDRSSGTRLSFREAYVELTGDRQVTGLIQNCDLDRLREAAGAYNFREAVSSATFGNILGDSITRAMVREYGDGTAYQDWRWLCDVVNVSDFRQQQRTRMGGYGNLPAVAENGAYNALTTPSDEVAKYAPTKRGGTETISLETIANDDVGAIRRIPLKLARAAGRTLYEFVYSFLDANGLIYDGKALFHADHANLGTAALADASFNAARLAIRQQVEAGSNKRLGLSLRHLAIPAELEELAYDMFRRDTNLDASFTQTSKPTVHVVDHWTDTNNWFATADNAQVPLIELGFYGGREDPELFVQDLPTQGSLFSNDQIKYKIRHIYGGAVLDFRGLYGAVVP